MPRIGQSLAVADRHVLRPPVAVVDQGVGTFGLAVVQDLLRCIEYEVYSHGAALPPAHGPASINIEHVGHAWTTYCLSCQVETYVKLDAHNWLGRTALNCRLTRVSGQTAFASPTVVRTLLPRLIPFKPECYISRWTVQRATATP